MRVFPPWGPCDPAGDAPVLARGCSAPWLQDVVVAAGQAQPGCSSASAAGCTGCTGAAVPGMQILTRAGLGALPSPAPARIPAVAMATTIYIYIFFPLITATSRSTVFSAELFPSRHRRAAALPTSYPRPLPNPEQVLCVPPVWGKPPRPLPAPGARPGHRVSEPKELRGDHSRHGGDPVPSGSWETGRGSRSATSLSKITSGSE